MRYISLIRITILSLSTLIITGDKLSGQDLQFGQLYANPLYLNPAFAGTDFCSRFSLNYRNLSPEQDGDFEGYSASFDKHIPILRGGIGVLATSEVSKEGFLTKNKIAGLYSFHQNLSHNIHFKIGLQGTYNQKKLDWNCLLQTDQVDPQDGSVYDSDRIPIASDKRYVDLSGGLLVYSSKYFFGAAVHHINQPNESLHFGINRLPVRFTIHGGMTTSLTKGGLGKISISPNIHYQQQADFSQLNFGMYLRAGAFVAGVWHRLEDSFIGLVGVHAGIMRIGYSYDKTTPRWGIESKGAHELSVAASLKCKNDDCRRIIPTSAF